MYINNSQSRKLGRASRVRVVCQRSGVDSSPTRYLYNFSATRVGQAVSVGHLPDELGGSKTLPYVYHVTTRIKLWTLFEESLVGWRHFFTWIVCASQPVVIAAPIITK